MKAIMVVALLCFTCYRLAAQDPAAPNPAPKASSTDPGKEAAIRKLFEVQGTVKTFAQVISVMSENMRPQITAALPPGGYRDQLVDLFLAKFKEKFDTKLMIDVAVPIYDKYFTKAEIENLTQFYSTPLGKKVISVLPQVMSESQSAGIKLGEKYGQEAMVEVLAEHPDLKKALEAASADAPKK